MSCIKNQVGLLKRQRISLSTTPLFQHFITYRPHQNTGVITIAEHQVSKVALMPHVEESGIVVLCLLASPHVKRLVHHDESHRITHIQEFRSWRIMRRTDGIDTHGLQFGEFTVEGILMQSSAQASKVVMLAHTIQLEVLTIQPKACLGIKLEITETCGGFHFIDYLTSHQQLCAHLIYIRVVATPLVE